ncbi:MAG: TIGR01212 family radical SAM protein [Fusobacteriaceae bacterium]
MSSRYKTLSSFLRDKFKEKTFKVSLDAGMNCPNRDGTISSGGCIFCSESGSGEFAGNRKETISEQIDKQLKFLEKKIKNGKVIAYFQNFTNTYSTVENLKKIYKEALSHPRVAGIAIATRPDCLSEEILELLSELSNEHFLWLELGLQTANDEVGMKINRGYPLSVYTSVCEKLKKRDIKFVTHIILGLPGEKATDGLETAKLAVKFGTWGIKIHLLYVVKNTKLHRELEKGSFELLEKEEYVERVVEILENIPKEIVIHRLTGDGEKETLVGPLWSLNKIEILNTIEKKLKDNESFQGKKS